MKKQKLVDDLVTVTGGFLKSLEGAKDYSKNKLREKITIIIEQLDFARQVELDEMKAMLAKSIAETKDLKKKVLNIEKKLIKRNK